MKSALLLLTIFLSTTFTTFAGASQVSRALQLPQVAHFLTDASTMSVHQSKDLVLIEATFPTEKCVIVVNSLEQISPAMCQDVGLIRVADDSPSFARDIQPIFQSKCSSCHGPTRLNKNDYTDYATATASKDKLNDRVLVKRDMPKSKLDDESQKLISDWLNGGMKP